MNKFEQREALNIRRHKKAICCLITAAQILERLKNEQVWCGTALAREISMQSNLLNVVLAESYGHENVEAWLKQGPRKARAKTA